MNRYEAVIPGRWSDRLTFSPAVRVGNLLFIAGTTATDENLRIVGVGDIAEQTRQIFRKWEPILKAAGASFDHIVETIRGAEFDVLYHWEVGSDVTNYFLPFFKLAPVQCTGAGLPATSGIGWSA